MSTRLICTLQGVPINQDESDKRTFWKSDGDIDADGANGLTLDGSGNPIFAYAPKDTGVDKLVNAGYPHGSYRDILVCGAGDSPIVFERNGVKGYQSKTAYFWKDLAWDDPARYLDSASVNYIVVEDFIRRWCTGVVLGCRAKITNRRNGKWTICVVGDIGPLYKIGEISMAAARAIGVNPNPKTGGEEAHVIDYELWPDEPAILNGVTYNLIPRAIRKS